MGPEQHGCVRTFARRQPNADVCVRGNNIVVRGLTSAFEAFRAATQNFPGGCRFSFMTRQRVSIASSGSPSIHSKQKIVQTAVYTGKLRASYGQGYGEVVSTLKGRAPLVSGREIQGF